MFPMTPLQSWAFLIMIGILVYLWVDYMFEKMEKDVWDERRQDDEDINI